MKLKRKKQKMDMFNLVATILLSLFCLVTIYPFFFVIIGSFSNGQDYMAGGVFLKPKNFTFANYIVLFSDSKIFLALKNTIIKTIGGTSLALIFTSMVSYAMSRKDLKGKKILYYVNIFTMFFGGGLIPYFLVINMVGLYDSFLVYIIPPMYSVYHMLVMATFYRGIPYELSESAKIDGANEFYIWLKIYLPLSKPVLMTVGLWTVVFHWNTYMSTLLYTSDPKLVTFQYYVLNMIKNPSYGLNIDGAILDQVSATTVGYAAIVLSIIPIILLYPLIHKVLNKGTIIGGIKE